MKALFYIALAYALFLLFGILFGMGILQ